MKRHPTPKEHLAPKQPDNPLSPGDLDDPEKLILIARKHFATSFPNKSRAGCPAPSMIWGEPVDRPPNDELRSHLFRCSECFNEYCAKIRNKIQDYSQQPGSATVTGNWLTRLIDALSRWRLPLFTSITASLLLTANLFIQRRQQTESPQTSYTRSQPAPVASVVFSPAPVPPAPNARQSSDSKIIKLRPSAPPQHMDSVAINLDLNLYKALGDTVRGGSRREEERKIALPLRRALLKLRLRKGSGAGRYRISVVDPNSKRLVGTSVNSHNGKSVNAVLDLQRAAPTAHRLRVERGDDLNEYLIEIAKP
jgi:hypothetical protein